MDWNELEWIGMQWNGMESNRIESNKLLHEFKVLESWMMDSTVHTLTNILLESHC